MFQMRCELGEEWQHRIVKSSHSWRDGIYWISATPRRYQLSQWWLKKSYVLVCLYCRAMKYEYLFFFPTRSCLNSKQAIHRNWACLVVIFGLPSMFKMWRRWSLAWVGESKDPLQFLKRKRRGKTESRRNRSSTCGMDFFKTQTENGGAETFHVFSFPRWQSVSP
jgi:hypothetical protein